MKVKQNHLSARSWIIYREFLTFMQASLCILSGTALSLYSGYIYTVAVCKVSYKLPLVSAENCLFLAQFFTKNIYSQM